jgi:hypothetical protein
MTTAALEPSRAGRRVAAVTAGLVAIVVLSLGTDVVLHATRVFPQWGRPMSERLFVIAAAYRVVYDVFGCWLAARLAPDRPMTHAIALGFVGLILSTAGAVATWNQGPDFGPRWYPLFLVVSALPSAWAGGWLREHQLRARDVG